ncbi:MAG TPA: PA14 domain-containing protein, partial [Candidatus Binataceae bacterium]|nr:PA14 domain-containing protein [Candidatus Binataceae bacterium]
AQFPEQAVGFVGLTYPRIKLLWYVLIDPQRGLFFCNPVLFLVIPGMVYFWRSGKHAEFWVVLEAMLAFVLFNASFGESIVSWGGGTATGPRQVAPAMPFFALALLFLPATYEFLLAVLGLLSALYMLAAVSTNPHFPYEFDNPVWQFALPHYFRGDLSFNRDTYYGGSSSVIGDSVAFNLGKLLGLPGGLQLVPLWLAWTSAATELMEDLQVWRNDRRAVYGSIAASLAIAILFVAPLTAPLQQRLATSARHGLLARYYMGNTPGDTPPHLVRVDANIDFNNVAELGAMPFSSSVTWTGAIIAPTPGTYQFGIRADDDGWITIDGQVVVPDPGPISHEQGNGSIELSAGTHRIVVGERNIAGDSSAHFYWQPPGGAAEIVPPEALIPDRYDPRSG